MRLVLHILATAVAVAVAAFLVPGITLNGPTPASRVLTLLVVAAIIGGLASYPLAAGGAILVGLLESFSSFWASAFKDVIVFTLIIPVLMWRSLTSHHVEEEE